VHEKEFAHIGAVIEFADKLVVLAEKGYAAFEDDESLMLNGTLRECAFRLRAAAEHAQRVFHG
jgi:hypothetical protein